MYNLAKVYVFNNTIDAKEFFLSNGIEQIEFDESIRYFSFRTTAWAGTGKMYWAKQL